MPHLLVAPIVHAFCTIMGGEEMTGLGEWRIMLQKEIFWKWGQGWAQSHDTHSSCWCLVSQDPNLKQQNILTAEGIIVYSYNSTQDFALSCEKLNFCFSILPEKQLK